MPFIAVLIPALRDSGKQLPTASLAYILSWRTARAIMEGTCLKTNKPPKTTKKHKMPMFFLDTGGKAFKKQKRIPG